MRVSWNLLYVLFVVRWKEQITHKIRSQEKDMSQILRILQKRDFTETSC